MQHDEKLINRVWECIQHAELVTAVETMYDQLEDFDKVFYKGCASNTPERFMRELVAQYNEAFTLVVSEFIANHPPDDGREAQSVALWYMKKTTVLLAVVLEGRQDSESISAYLARYLALYPVRPMIPHVNSSFGSFEELEQDVRNEIVSCLNNNDVRDLTKEIIENMEEPNIFKKVLGLGLCSEDDLLQYLEYCMRDGYQKSLSNQSPL